MPLAIQWSKRQSFNFKCSLTQSLSLLSIYSSLLGRSSWTMNLWTICLSPRNMYDSRCPFTISIQSAFTFCPFFLLKIPTSCLSLFSPGHIVLASELSLNMTLRVSLKVTCQSSGQKLLNIKSLFFMSSTVTPHSAIMDLDAHPCSLWQQTLVCYSLYC